MIAISCVLLGIGGSKILFEPQNFDLLIYDVTNTDGRKFVAIGKTYMNAKEDALRAVKFHLGEKDSLGYVPQPYGQWEVVAETSDQSAFAHARQKITALYAAEYRQTAWEQIGISGFFLILALLIGVLCQFIRFILSGSFSDFSFFFKHFLRTTT
jgi:hypothetical protein